MKPDAEWDRQVAWCLVTLETSRHECEREYHRHAYRCVNLLAKAMDAKTPRSTSRLVGLAEEAAVQTTKWRAPK